MPLQPLLRTLPLKITLAALAALWIAPLLPLVAPLDRAAIRTTFDNFPLLRWYLNSLIATSATTALVVATGSLAGYAFARIPFRGREPLFVAVLAALLVPPEITFIPLFLGFASLNLADTFVGLVLPQAANVLTLYLFREFFAQLPQEIEDAARVDGASRLGVFWRVVLPLSWPVLIAVAALTFVGSWNNFLWPLIISTTDATRTLPVGIAAYPSLAGATVTALPALLVFLLLSRHITRGVHFTGPRG